LRLLGGGHSIACHLAVLPGAVTIAPASLALLPTH
jgi:hypothetical protein